MLMVDHYVSPSKIHGLGVFTKFLIPRGALVWQFDPMVDRIIHEATLAKLPKQTVQLIQTHAEYHRESGHYVLGTDGDYYMNHSKEPTLIDHGSTMFAARDLKPGDELTCDYRVVKVAAFDPEMEGRYAAIRTSGRRVEKTSWNEKQMRAG